MAIAVRNSHFVPASSCEIPELIHSTPTAAIATINPIDEDYTVIERRDWVRTKLAKAFVCVCVTTRHDLSTQRGNSLRERQNKKLFHATLDEQRRCSHETIHYTKVDSTPKWCDYCDLREQARGGNCLAWWSNNKMLMERKMCAHRKRRKRDFWPRFGIIFFALFLQLLALFTPHDFVTHKSTSQWHGKRSFSVELPLLLPLLLALTLRDCCR